MNRRSDVLHPLDTCHGKEQARASCTSPSARLRIGGPSFRAQLGDIVADWRFWLALMVLVLLIGKATGSPSTDYYNGIQITK